MNVTEKTGEVVAALGVADDEELMLMTSRGQSVRIRISQIRETGRNAQGVKLMELKDGEVIQDVATVVPDEEVAAKAEEAVEGAEADANAEVAADVRARLAEDPELAAEVGTDELADEASGPSAEG